MLSSVSVAPGRLLISEPFMMDPNFKRSVILMTEYAGLGAMGFVLNHLSEYLLGDLMPDMTYSEFPVYIGGPVAHDTLHFIHCCPQKIDEGIDIGNGIFWGGDFENVRTQVSNYNLREDEIKFFAGYSGWTPGQLDDEIKEDTWIVADKFDPAVVFTNDEQDLWKEMVRSLGQRYAHIANFPENPAMN